MSSKRSTGSGYVPLHVRSAHSHLFGASRLEELIRTALGLGYRTMALTDRNGLYGSVLYYQQAKEAGLEPILGVELVEAEDAVDPKRGTATPARAVCLARNRGGYRTLCRLTTARHLVPAFDLAEALAADHEDVYVLVPDAALLARLDGRMPEGRLFALVEEFGDRSTRLRNAGLARAASKRRVPLAASGAVAFHAPGRYRAHRTLRAIDTLSTVADVAPHALAHPKAYLKGPEEMAALSTRYPEAALNTVRIAADCRLELPLGRPIFPRADLPEDETSYSHLAKLAFAGLRRRIRPLRPEAVARLEKELAVIDRLGFADYFLIMHEIVAWMQTRDIPCVGRGSAAGSLVAYALGLSGVDPLKYGLLFERFLNLERADCPDIDLDICWRARDEVIKHVYDTYGHDRVAMISTHQTFKAKSAFREVAKAHGLPPAEVDRLSRRLPYFSAAGIRDAVLSFPECRDFPVGRTDVARVIEIAAALDSLPRHLSVHVGGLVIADRPLTDHLPLQVATKGVVITQPEADAVKALGLVKMDLLAQRSLSILATAVREIEKTRGVRIDPMAIEDGDPKTAALLAKGDTFGCFQIESPGMRNLLKMMEARERTDVILGLSLIRPGPASSGMKDRFVRRRRGLEAPEYLHPALKEVLGSTYGVMLYQEDVIRVAHAVAGFTLAEGDRLRKDLAKGVAPSAREDWRTRFIRRAIAGGARRPDAETLWERLAQFAAYSYCKAHASTYGEIAYRATYLRAHYPAEFVAAVLANQSGYYERRTYVEDARRRGVAVLGPDVNVSGVEPTSERLAEGRVGLRISLMDVRGLGQRSMRGILEAREAHGPFASVADVVARVKLSREELENLALAGAFDGLVDGRAAALWQVHALASRPAEAAEAGRLFAAPAPAPAPLDLPDYTPLQKLQAELYALGGLTPSAGPMEVYGPLLGLNGNVTPLADLAGRGGEAVTVCGVLFAERRARTKHGEFMKFISLEDTSGVVEAVLLPNAYQRLGGRLTTRGPYRVTGTVEDHYGAVSLKVTDLVLVSPIPCEGPRRLPRFSGNPV